MNKDKCRSVKDRGSKNKRLKGFCFLVSPDHHFFKLENLHHLGCHKLPKNNSKTENICFLVIWLMIYHLYNER